MNGGRARLLSVRYLPFLAVASVMCLLVLLTPSTGPRTTSFVADDRGDFSGAAAGDGSGSGASAGSSDGSDLAGGSGSAVRSGDGSTGGGKPGAGGGARGGASSVDGASLANCGPDGLQKAPVYHTGVACRPSFTGDNGGATMQGVTATEVRYVWYNTASNPVVDGILSSVGFARTPGPFCDAMRAFEKSTQRYFEMSGRKLVSRDGPGNQAGSANCDGKYKYFQSQCPSAPDPACLRADARVIAEELKPAVVLAPRGLPVFYEELGRRGTITIGYNGSRERFQQFAPYLWGFGLSIERMFGLNAEYYCQRLVGQEPDYGGDDVKAYPGTRHIGLIYADNGDGSLKPAVDLWLKTVRGCGDPTAQTYTYVSDASRAQQQASNIAAQLRADGVTTVSFCCDPSTILFYLQAFSQNRYFPEHFIVPISSIASDAAGNIYEDAGFGDQWRHAFGVSNFAINQVDATLDYRKAYADGDGPGGMAGIQAIEVESFTVFKQMMQMIHSAGPRMTPPSVFDGMQGLPVQVGGKRNPTFDYAPPDPFKAQVDVAEVWWNPDLYSYYSDTNGSMCVLNDGRRFSLGEVPSSPAKLFAGGVSACARL